MSYIYCRFLNQCNTKVLKPSFSRMISFTGACKKIFKIQDEQDFEDRVMKSDKPVVIDFQASWCGPCKLLEPRLETIIGSKNENVHLAKIDIDDNAELAMKYDVQAVPHVIGFKNGKAHSNFVGLKDEDEINSFVDELIGK